MCKKPSQKKVAKLNIAEAARRVENICETSTINDGNDLNIALEEIVRDCTTVINIKSNHRIIRPHINRDLILAIRERDRIYPLINLYPDNTVILNIYNQLVEYINFHNYHSRTRYEYDRLQSAAGDSRKQEDIQGNSV